MSQPDGAAEIRRIIDGAEHVTPESPRPLMRELPPADPYPIDALGDLLGPAARAIQDRVQAPLAIGAQSVFGAAALAVQGHADIVLPIGPGQARPSARARATLKRCGRSAGARRHSGRSMISTRCDMPMTEPHTIVRGKWRSKTARATVTPSELRSTHWGRRPCRRSHRC